MAFADEPPIQYEPESTMDAQRITTAETCLNAAYDKSMAFPEIVGTLIKAGFEG